MLSPTRLSSKAIWLLLTVCFIVIDQVSKIWISHTLVLGQVTPVLAFFSLTLVHNTGAAFSLFADSAGWQHWFFISLACLVSLFIVCRLVKPSKYSLAHVSGFALVLAGAVGNVIDRILHGYVIDFLLFYIKSYQWPVFNIADTIICLGACLLVFDLLANDSD